MILCVLAEWAQTGVAGAGVALVSSGLMPRVAIEEREENLAGRLWVDVRGLPAYRGAGTTVAECLREGGASGVRHGIAATPVAAYAAAVVGGEEGSVVAAGEDREFLAPLPLGLLEPDERLVALLEGVGIETCGALAALDREAVEVRFGGPAARVWRRARADDDRRLFRPVPRESPAASLDFVDYVVSDPERLLFTANALLGNVCATLAERGAHARRMTLSLSLANGETWTRSIGAARATASRTTWLRRIRAELERLTVPDAVTGVSVAAGATERAAALQGDLFDAGFATAAAVAGALERLLESQGRVVVRPATSGHPLAERRMEFEDADEHVNGAERPIARVKELVEVESDGLTLQLLREPRTVLVETVVRRDHLVPVRYRDGVWRQLLTAAGPERVSGGQWEGAYAREYYRCVGMDGALVWIYRDGRAGQWYLHGWWD
jgi:protein ImuB